MRELFQRHKATIATFLAVILPLLVLYVHGKAPGESTFFRHQLLKVTAPAQNATHRLIGSVESLWDGYMALIDTESDNEALRAKVLGMEGRLARARLIEDENGVLRHELAFKRSRRELNLVAAHVIAKDVSAFSRVVRVRIDLGGRDKVREGMPVLTHEGLVGRLRQVAGGYAEVMLTVDTRSEVAVRVLGKSATGSLRGTGDRNEYLAQLLYLPGGEKLEVGDRLVTSGHDQVFPPNIVVGTIRSLTRRQDGVHEQLEVTPVVRFSVLDTVQVMVGTRVAPAKEVAR